MMRSKLLAKLYIVMIFVLLEDSSDSLTATKALVSKGRSLSKMERFDDALQCLSDALRKDHTATKPSIEVDVLVAKGQVARGFDEK